MLPDFPGLKRRLESQIARFIRGQIPAAGPLLKGLSSYTQHEGRDGELVRADGSRDSTKFEPMQFGIKFSREEMRTFDGDAVRKKLIELATEMADRQEQLLIARVGVAAASVGNVVSAGGDFKREHLFEILRKIELDFDSVTGKPKAGYKWVMHPEAAKGVTAKLNEWQDDPKFQEELKRIEEVKREEWRAREARRKLAD